MGQGGARTGGVGGTAAAGRSSGGGAAGAGTSNAGAGGANATLALPEGCNATSQIIASSRCNADMLCDGTHLVVTCNQKAAGWSCSCLQGPSITNFDFSDTTGVRTCELIAEACLHPERVTGNQTCELTHSGGGTTCTLLDTCTNEEALDGVKFSSQSSWTASCSPAAYDISACTCPDSFAPDHWIAQDDFSAGCDFLKPLCMGNPPTPTGDWTCETQFENAAPDYGCHSWSTCSEPAELDDGTPLTLGEEYNLNCDPTDDGRNLCQCESIAGYEKLTLYVDVPGNDVAACRVGTDVCAEVVALDLAAPACTLPVDDRSAKHCAQTRNCSQGATAGSHEVTLLTTSGLSCDAHEDGTWTCSCSGPTGLRFDMPASDTPPCEQNLARCDVFGQTI